MFINYKIRLIGEVDAKSESEECVKFAVRVFEAIAGDGNVNKVTFTSFNNFSYKSQTNIKTNF